MFIDSFMHDVAYVRGVEICMENMICYGSENFGLRSLHDDYVGLTGAYSHFYYVATYRFENRFVLRR